MWSSKARCCLASFIPDAAQKSSNSLRQIVHLCCSVAGSPTVSNALDAGSPDKHTAIFLD
jgi:hypothetical protein